MGSGQKYAEVYVDIRSLGADRPFDYRIPPEMTDKLKIGSVVLVPVKSRREIGYIVSIKDSTDIDPKKTKPISSIVDIPPLFDNGRIELARWMSSYYIQPLTSVLRLFLPPGKKTRAAVDNKSIGYKFEAIIRLCGSAREGSLGKGPAEDMLNGPLLKNSGAQKRIVEHLLKAGKEGLRRADLLASAATSSETIRKLVEKNIVKIDMERVRRSFKYDTAPDISTDRIVLNQYQKKAVDSVLAAIDQVLPSTSHTFLHHSYENDIPLPLSRISFQIFQIAGG